MIWFFLLKTSPLPFFVYMYVYIYIFFLNRFQCSCWWWQSFVKHYFLICVFFSSLMCKQFIWKRICLTLAFCWAGQLKPVVPCRCTTAYNLHKLIGTTNKQWSELALEIITQAQQQRPESPTVTLTWRACKYKVYKLHQRYILEFENVPLVEFIYLVVGWSQLFVVVLVLCISSAN